MSKSSVVDEIKARHEQMQGAGGAGRSRFEYGEHPDFEAWIVCPDRPVAAKRMMFPSARVYENGTKQIVPWTAEGLITYLGPTLADWRSVYEGEWRIEVRKPKRLPTPTSRNPGAARAVRNAMGDVFKKIAERTDPRPMGKAAPPPVPPKQDISEYECNKGHRFAPADVDRKRCSIGCCPVCEETNPDYHPVRPVEFSPPAAAPPMFTDKPLYTGTARPHKWEEIAHEFTTDDDESREAREP
jgi:hypothetical protein